MGGLQRTRKKKDEQEAEVVSIFAETGVALVTLNHSNSGLKVWVINESWELWNQVYVLPQSHYVGPKMFCFQSNVAKAVFPQEFRHHFGFGFTNSWHHSHPEIL